MKLRKSGWTYEKIAMATVRKFGASALPRGYDHRYAYKDVRRELDRLRSDVAEDTADVRDMEIQRLDAMLEGMWSKAARGNVAAVDRVLKIMERRCKILGIDAPTKQEHTGKDGGPIQHNVAAQKALDRIYGEES